MRSVDEIAKIVEENFANDAELQNEWNELVAFLKASEYMIVQLMLHNKLWSGPVPPNPGGKGDEEFGLAPYWIHHPPVFIQNYINSNPVLRTIWHIVERDFPSYLDKTNYDNLIKAAEGRGIVSSNGTILGDRKYEQLDPEWMWAVVDNFIVVFAGDRANFSNKQVQPLPLAGKHSDRVNIALISDWGTGEFATGPAIDMIGQAMSVAPDYLIHLGDVYYAGTGGDFLPLDEEKNNFLKYWPKTDRLAAGRSFTMNSNHEMYSGAKGYFHDALTDPRFVNQQNTSYFALQYGGWTVVGLDSAYYSTSPMCMLGSIGGPTGDQATWIKRLGLNPKKTIILTHHTGMDDTGTEEYGLWGEVSGALGGDPAAWYWGHIHNGISYPTPTKTPTPHNTRARCLGNGALPYGKAWGLAAAKANGTVDFYYDTFNRELNDGIRIYNGFMLLTIKTNGDVREAFYQQNTLNPVYGSDYS